MGEIALFLRLVLASARGVFFNAMFVVFLLDSRTRHRFVGYLDKIVLTLVGRLLLLMLVQ